jgi:hypothetical protein
MSELSSCTTSADPRGTLAQERASLARIKAQTDKSFKENQRSMFMAGE